MAQTNRKKIFYNLKFKIQALWILFLVSSVQASWESGKISAIIDNQTLMLSDRSFIKVAGIQLPDLFFPEPASVCFHKQVYKTLSELLLDQKIKFKKTDIAGEVHVKFEGTQNLALFLLSQGWAQMTETVTPYNKQYQEAQSEARRYKKGLWGSCQPYGRVRQYLFHQGLLSFDPLYRSYLAPVSTGWVKAVIDGQTIVLTNGLKVKLLGLNVPDLDDPRASYRCFAESSRDFLKKILVGRKVILARDQSQVSEINTVARYVEIPPNTNRNGLMVNAFMIAQGYARSKVAYPDLKYKLQFESLQADVFSSPKGAWEKCLFKSSPTSQK